MSDSQRQVSTMENRKDPSSAMRKTQQGQGNTQSATSQQPAKPSLPLQQQQANTQQSLPYEPKLVRDPKTGDYYDQNQQSRSAVQQQYAASPDRDTQGEYKRKPISPAQQGSKQSKMQAK